MNLDKQQYVESWSKLFDQEIDQDLVENPIVLYDLFNNQIISFLSDDEQGVQGNDLNYVVFLVKQGCELESSQDQHMQNYIGNKAQIEFGSKIKNIKWNSNTQEDFHELTQHYKFDLVMVFDQYELQTDRSRDQTLFKIAYFYHQQFMYQLFNQYTLNRDNLNFTCQYKQFCWKIIGNYTHFEVLLTVYDSNLVIVDNSEIWTKLNQLYELKLNPILIDLSLNKEEEKTIFSFRLKKIKKPDFKFDEIRHQLEWLYQFQYFLIKIQSKYKQEARIESMKSVNKIVKMLN